MELLHLRDRQSEGELVELARARGRRCRSSRPRGQLYGETRVLAFSVRQELNGAQPSGGSSAKPEEARMKTADEALSREIERGMTRQDILRRAAALGIVVTGRNVRTAHRGGVRLDARSSEAARSARRRPAARRTSSTASTSSRSRTSCASSRGSTASPASTRRARSSSISPRSSRRRRPTSTSSASARAIEFHNGKTLDDRRRHLLDQAHEEPEAEAVRQRGVRRDRPERHQEARQADRAGSSCRGPTSR